MEETNRDSLGELLEQQQTLARFGELALRSDDLGEILNEAYRLVGTALHTNLAKILELQEDRKTLLVRAGFGWGPRCRRQGDNCGRPDLLGRARHQHRRTGRVE